MIITTTKLLCVAPRDPCLACFPRVLASEVEAGRKIIMFALEETPLVEWGYTARISEQIYAFLQAFAQALQSNQKLTKLTSLNLSHASIGNAGAQDQLRRP